MSHATQKEQTEIQTMIDEASPAKREEYAANAREVLEYTKDIGSRMILSNALMKDSNLAIETLVRLEATAFSKGSLYRLKRRVQYARA